MNERERDRTEFVFGFKILPLTIFFSCKLCLPLCFYQQKLLLRHKEMSVIAKAMMERLNKTNNSLDNGTKTDIDVI